MYPLEYKEFFPERFISANHDLPESDEQDMDLDGGLVEKFDLQTDVK